MEETKEKAVPVAVKVEQSKPVESKVKIPTLEELLEAGVQFGHETQRWHPKMSKYIYSSKNNIHIINLEETAKAIKKAADFLSDISSKGNVIFVGTKRQSSRIIKAAAVECGAFFVDQRWAGGVLTNFGEVKKSLFKLNNLEKSFEEGVQDRTKYEVNLMKKDWAKLNRLYSGIKTMQELPKAVIVVDAKFERSAVREAKNLNIPVVGIVDSNTNPDLINYIIPANDDAIGSIKIIIDTLAKAIVEGNKGSGVKHKLEDYSKSEIEIKKTEIEEGKAEELAVIESAEQEKPKTVRKISSAKQTKDSSGKGILERLQEKKEKDLTK